MLAFIAAGAGETRRKYAYTLERIASAPSAEPEDGPFGSKG